MALPASPAVNESVGRSVHDVVLNAPKTAVDRKRLEERNPGAGSTPATANCLAASTAAIERFEYVPNAVTVESQYKPCKIRASANDASGGGMSPIGWGF